MVHIRRAYVIGHWRGDRPRSVIRVCVCRLSFSDAIITVDGYGFIFLCENITLNGEQEEGDLEKYRTQVDEGIEEEKEK